jgi:hypothetical protein
VASVGYPGGGFQMTGKGRWGEADTDGNRFSFVEERRNDIGVYISDNSRGVRVYLNISQKKVFYSDKQSPAPRPLYPITRASLSRYYP